VSRSAALLQKIVEMAGGPDDTGFVLALSGDGLDQVPESFHALGQTWNVTQPQTELSLRRALWKAGGAPLVALVPPTLADTLRSRPDVLHRARGRRVHALEISDILGIALGVPVVGTDDDDIQRLALEHVDQLRVRLKDRTLPTVVDRQLLEDLLCDASLGAEFRRATAPELLASWLRDGIDDWGDAVRKLVERRLPTLHGTVGRVLAWGLNGGMERLDALVVHGALLDCDADDLPEGAWGPLADARQETSVAIVDDMLGTTLATLASSTLEALAADAQGYLTRAESIARVTLPKRALSANRVLPLGLSNRIAELALDAASGKPLDPQSIDELYKHRAATSQRTTLDVLRSMGRLSRYLAAEESAADSPAKMIEDWRASGAFADLAALRLRRSLAGATSLAGQAGKLLKLWRERRDAENKRWAELLAGGFEDVYLAAGVMPLHRVSDRAIAPVAAEGRKLFVVVLDGCSFPVMIDLLERLREGTVNIGVDLGRTSKLGSTALTPLPTITSHCRGALFLGSVPNDPLATEADGQEAVTDKAKLNQNKKLRSVTRQLFLKGDLADGGLALQAALRSDEKQLVAAVFNAIDDQIGSSNTGAAIHIRPEEIAGFLPALQSAFDAGREVLITADHGHSPFFAKNLRRGKNPQPRYLPMLEADTKVPDDFIEIDAGNLGGDGQRKAFAWAMSVYLGRPQVGFHGGCGLEEMVVPMLWLKRDGVRLNQPAWWYSLPGSQTSASATATDETPKQAAGPASKARKKPPPKSRAPKTTIPPGQLDLIAPSNDQQLLAKGLSEEVIASLDEFERQALLTIAANTQVKVSDLASAIGRRPSRVPGMMSRLQTRLHKRGASCFETARLPTGEPLYRWTLTGGRA